MKGILPHGLATYRLRLASRQDTGGLVVYLPEVFSACRVFINGREAFASALTALFPMVHDLTLTVPDAPEIEIIIQTANYSHYYSGITYPPVLGTAQTIHLQNAVRMGFYGLLCFFSLSAALLSAAVWLGSRKQSGRKVYYWLGILALTFSLHCAYPFFHTAGLPFTACISGLEDGAQCSSFNITAKSCIRPVKDPEKESSHLHRTDRSGNAACQCASSVISAALFTLFHSLVRSAYFLVQAWHSLSAAYFFHYGAPGENIRLACRRNCRTVPGFFPPSLHLTAGSLPVPAGLMNMARFF